LDHVGGHRGGRAVEHDVARAEPDDPGAVLERRLELVLAHDQCQAALAVDAPEIPMIDPASVGSRLAGGLVPQDHLRLLGEGARDGHALLLAARERVGAAGGEVGEADLREAVAGESPVPRREAPDEARPLGDVAEPARQHVVEDRGAPHEVELLEDHADLPAHQTESAGIRPRHELARDPHRPEVGSTSRLMARRNVVLPAPLAR
jgi:hypothetical protein